MRVLEALRLGLPAAIVASLCCLSPLVLVLFGAGLSSFGVRVFTQTLGPYEWMFFLAGVLLLAASTWLHLRGKGVCTLSQARARRNEVLNTLLLVSIVSLITFLALYGVVGAFGQRLGLWASSS
jgi:hypothetical protein